MCAINLYKVIALVDEKIHFVYSSEASMLTGIYSNSLDSETSCIFCQILKEVCIKCLITSSITLSPEIHNYASLKICKCECVC